VSEFGWIDFSSSDRNVVSQIIAMNSEPGTLDELGIGQLRDAYADVLFPGFSTIQTRAKYFITIPRMIRDYWVSGEKKKSQELIEYLKVKEWELTQTLCKQNYDNKDIGIIGGSNYLDNKDVARHPSSIYWNGLRVLKLINTEVSLAEFSRDLLKKDRTMLASSEDENSTEDSITPLVPLGELYDPNWYESVSIKLNGDEAALLKHKLTQPHLEHTVLYQIFKHNLELEVIDQKYDQFPKLVDYLSSKNISATCLDSITRANEFSNAIHGAHIRYNTIIAQNSGNEKLVENYSEQFHEWYNNNQTIFNSKSAYNWCSILSDRRHIRPQVFIQNWNNLLQDFSGNQAEVEELDTCIRKRAQDNKGARSLLYKDLGSTPKWEGMSTLSYRWPQVRTILKDIVEVLHA